MRDCAIYYEFRKQLHILKIRKLRIRRFDVFQAEYIVFDIFVTFFRRFANAPSFVWEKLSFFPQILASGGVDPAATQNVSFSAAKEFRVYRLVRSNPELKKNQIRSQRQRKKLDFLIVSTAGWSPRRQCHWSLHFSPCQKCSDDVDDDDSVVLQSGFFPLRRSRRNNLLASIDRADSNTWWLPKHLSWFRRKFQLLPAFVCQNVSVSD
jgi:hypothetical protein